MKRLLLILSLAAGLTFAGCSSDDSGHSHGEDGDHTHATETEQHEAHDDTGDAHQHEGDEGQGHSHSGEEGTHTHEDEEGDKNLGLDATYDEVRRGVRLTLSYNTEANTFSGTIENTTEEALPQVSVGVQLSNGTELGPTEPVDLGAGESRTIELDAAGQTFDSWTAASELGSGGHSHGEDGDHTHN